MPTIDELDPAIAAADTDALPASQGGVLRRVSRAQLLAGMQPGIALAPGQILGRQSGGLGAPEALGVGAGLSLGGGTLSALPLSALPPGIPAGQASVLAAGTSAARSLAELLADAVGPESFGAVGDGVTDDTAALAAAIGSGRPVRLGPRTYRVDGQWMITQPNTVLLGTPGLSVLKRGQQQGNGAWIAVMAPGFRADGITFDANNQGVTQESWTVLVTGACTSSDIHRCTFTGGVGAVLGSGLVLQSATFDTSHVVRDCVFANNAAHGIWVQACRGVLVSECRAHGNGAHGINVDFNDPGHVQQVRLVQVSGNRCWGNQRGIAVGNYNVPNAEPPVWGNAQPDAACVLVSGNICHDNVAYGISASGRAILVSGNLLADNGTTTGHGAGLLANFAASRAWGNTVTGTSFYGIDAGGCEDADISGNHILGHGYAINCGGSRNLRVDGNVQSGFSLAGICVFNVESDGQGRNFGIAADAVALTGNRIAMGGTAEGIWLIDGPRRVLVEGNDFTGRTPEQCLRADTDSVIVRGNRHDYTARFICNPAPAGGRQRLVFPDIADGVMVTWAPSGVQSIVSARQAAMEGRISFVRVTAGGSGYTQAAVNIGGGGTGAQAQAIISNGTVIGIAVTSPGSGYGAVGTTVPVTIAGDGTGAAATAYAAPPLAEERTLLVRCNADVVFARAGSLPLQENWTRGDLLVAADGDVEWTATWGMWRAGRFALPAHLAPDAAGITTLGPRGPGRVRLASAAEATGALSAIGRGTPEGTVSAPPGSDYRNLDGGAGATFWVKRTGTGATGWVAVT